MCQIVAGLHVRGRSLRSWRSPGRLELAAVRVNEYIVSLGIRCGRRLPRVKLKGPLGEVVPALLKCSLVIIYISDCFLPVVPVLLHIVVAVPLNHTNQRS